MLKNGRFHVVEYSEISTSQAHAVNEKNELIFSAANIINVVYRLDFLKRILNENLGDLIKEFHVAKKKIPHYDIEKAVQVQTTVNNGYKFELFFFDAYLLAKSMGLIETVREEEFAPVKNAPGSKDGDSPDTARELISKLHQKWLENAGFTFKGKWPFALWSMNLKSL